MSSRRGSVWTGFREGGTFVTTSFQREELAQRGTRKEGQGGTRTGRRQNQCENRESRLLDSVKGIGNT